MKINHFKLDIKPLERDKKYLEIQFEIGDKESGLVLNNTVLKDAEALNNHHFLDLVFEEAKLEFKKYL